MHRSENYIQKGDGSFRDATLISPILFLVLQCIGKKISDIYVSERPFNIAVYYAGNFENFRPKYKQDYDNFFKNINMCIGSYQYFIKTDVTNFFNNINVNCLMNRIDEVCNSEKVRISQTELLLYKELLNYCGAGRFPLIENSMASSYLATVVYMDEIDCKLYKFIKEKMPNITAFQIVRYVDDMYILFSTKREVASPKEIYNTIINEYSTLLKHYCLSLNVKKCCVKESFEINEELKKSLYDEVFHDRKCDIEEIFSGKIKLFLEEIYTKLENDGIDNNEYMKIVEKYFYEESIVFSPNEVYNYLIYENDKELKNEDVTKLFIKIINLNLAFLALDPKRLTAMFMKTGSERVVKAMLNRLFMRHRDDTWNSYDTTVAIIYLIQSKFRHIDLIGVITSKNAVTVV